MYLEIFAQAIYTANFNWSQRRADNSPAARQCKIFGGGVAGAA
jgi:hypothetical protein